MFFSIEPGSSKSVYQQIVDRVKNDVARGVLKTGDRISTIRDLAAQLRVNRNTVAKAYKELEQQGIIYTRPGGGSFIAELSNDLRRRERLKVLEHMARDLVVEAFHYQVEEKELLRIVSKEIEKTLGRNK